MACTRYRAAGHACIDPNFWLNKAVALLGGISLLTFAIMYLRQDAPPQLLPPAGQGRTIAGPPPSTGAKWDKSSCAIPIRSLALPGSAVQGLGV